MMKSTGMISMRRSNRSSLSSSSRHVLLIAEVRFCDVEFGEALLFGGDPPFVALIAEPHDFAVRPVGCVVERWRFVAVGTWSALVVCFTSTRAVFVPP
jgi:hypothetical protein